MEDNDSGVLKQIFGRQFNVAEN